MTSRKLAGAIAAILGIVGIVVIAAYQGAELSLTLTAVGAVAGLGGYQVMRQARIDEAEGSVFYPFEEVLPEDDETQD